MDRTRTTIIAAAALSLMAVAGYGFRAGEPRGAASLGLSGVRVDERVYLDETMDEDFLEVLRAREVLFRTYDPDADEPVWLFLGYFDRQKEGSQVHSPRHCYPGSGWNIEQELEAPIEWRDGVLRALVVNNGVERRLVCFWYQTPFGIEDDVFRLKMALTRQALMRRPQDVVFASVSTPLDSGLEGAWERAAGVARDVEGEIARLYAALARERA
ncbi:MAG TPA: EpsI family protein [Candidatus Krumholzibacteria bacterium]|nr:EpsI family protein [Candidatus Krumholzibacteria bacterium]